MEEDQMHLSIDSLQSIVDEARTLHQKNPNTTVPIVRITKTAWRQTPEAEDTVSYELLEAVSINENVESHGV